MKLYTSDLDQHIARAEHRGYSNVRCSVARGIASYLRTVRDDLPAIRFIMRWTLLQIAELVEAWSENCR